MRTALFLVLVACTSNPGATPDAAADAAAAADATRSSSLGTITNVTAVSACPAGAPADAKCKQVTVTGCPGLETEPLVATIAIQMPAGTVKGTIVHFSGGEGTNFQNSGTNGQAGDPDVYPNAGFRNVMVAWASTWELTKSLGIKAAACRPATVLKWIFDEPTLHNGSRTIGFCGEGFSAGSGQVGYTLAHYGMADYLDYVNLLSGPPFARIDLGCNGDAPRTTTVCGAVVTAGLPERSLDPWENIVQPNFCGMTNVPPAELARWRSDSIAIGGVYDYPKTRAEFFDCTNNASGVTAGSRYYYDTVSQAEGNDAMRAVYHCFSAADNCDGEQLGDGVGVAIQAMIDECRPRHM